MINDLIKNAYKVLDGCELTRLEALDLALKVKKNDLLDLCSLAGKVRKKFASDFHVCSIINAKSGKCSQNCKFCAQSAFYETGIKTYDLLPKEEVLKQAKIAYDNGVRYFGYVTSGVGYTKVTDEFLKVLDTLDLLHQELPDMKICAAMGILSDETAKLLAEHHLYRYNMNLQTAPKCYAALVSDMHSIQDKINTVKYAQKYGITNCTGGIFGLGETWEDRVDMAFAIKELDVESLTLNILLPIKGTPLQDAEPVTPLEAAKIFAIYRLINPTKTLKFAAGRETTMKDFQGLLMLSGLNGIITGGYLTTRGRSTEDDFKMLKSLSEF